MALLTDKPAAGPQTLFTPPVSSRSSSRTEPGVHRLELQLCNPQGPKTALTFWHPLLLPQ